MAQPPTNGHSFKGKGIDMFRLMHRLAGASLAACLFSALLAVSAGTAHAQGQAVPKEPGGPWVYYQMPQWHCTAGEFIEWTVTVSNSISSDPLYADYWDKPQSDECLNGGVSERVWEGGAQPAGNGNETAPQSTMSYIDPNGDGNCEESVLDAAGGLVICDMATQSLRILNAVVPGNTPGFPPRPGVATIRFLTTIDAAAAGGYTCNWGFIYNDKDNADPSDDALIQPTGDPQKRVFGCTCLFIDPPTGIDFEASKAALPETVPLIPNDPNSTIVYTITATNTGTEDIAGATLADQFTAAQGLEWVDVVSCPLPLTCNIVGPRNLQVTGWNLPATDPDTSQQIKVRARVTCGAATDDDTGVVCNQGTFSLSGREFPTDDPTQGGLSDPTCLPVVFSNLTESTKRWTWDDTNGDGELDPGERVRFTIGARNTGSLTAKSVVVTDDLSASTCFDLSTIVPEDGGTLTAGVITWALGDLPGAMMVTRDVHFSVVLLTSDVCCNQATLQSTERSSCGMAPIPTNDPTTMTASDPTCALPGPRPNLDIQKVWNLEQDVDGSGGISGTDMVSFTITIHNNGPGTATAATFTDAMPACLTRFLNNLPNGNPGSRVYPNEVSTTDGTDWGTDASVPYGGAFNPGRVVINNVGGANGIIPGETVTIKFYVSLADLRCCNQGFLDYAEAPEAQPTDDPGTPGLVNDRTCFAEPPVGPNYRFTKNLDIFDINGDGYVGPGDRAVYTIVLTSTGDAPLTNVVITDPSDACYALDEASIVVTGAGTNATVPGSNTVTVNATGDMAPADVLTVVFGADFTVDGTCCNQATFTCGEFSGILSDDPRDFITNNATCVDVTAPPVPSYQLTLDKEALQIGCQDPGTKINFTLTVTNTGADPVTNWSISDPLAPEFTGAQVDPPLILVGSTVTLDGTALGVLVPGDSRAFTYSASLPCTPGGNVTNTATVTYETTGTASDSVTSSWGLPDFTASTKQLVAFDANGNGYNEPGEPVSYSITVANNGTCAGKNVTVTDALDARFDPATIAFGPGSTGTLAGSTITWDATTVPALGSLPVGATVTLTFDVQVNTATAQDQLIPNSVVVDAPDMVSRCPSLSIRQQSPATGANGGQVQWGTTVVGGVDLLRNAMISCRLGAFATLHQTVGGVPAMPPQASRDLTASNPVPPYTATGDASIASPPVNRTCPQVDLTNAANRDNRVVVYYQLTDATITDLRASKSGNDVVLNWTP